MMWVRYFIQLIRTLKLHSTTKFKWAEFIIKNKFILMSKLKKKGKIAITCLTYRDYVLTKGYTLN